MGDTELPVESLSVLPLSPSQQWLLDHRPREPEQFNQSMAFRIQRPLSISQVEQVVNQALDAHEAFSLRYAEVDPGCWRQWLGPRQPVSVSYLDLTGTRPGDRRHLFDGECQRLHRSLHIGAGRGVAASVVDFGVREHPLLVIVAHHLLVDAVSWRILAEDLAVACQAAYEGTTAHLAPSGSFAQWSAALHQQVPYWTDEVPQWCARVPAYARWPRDDDEASLEVPDIQRMSFDSVATRCLLAASQQSGYGLEHLLLAAMGMAVQSELGLDGVIVDVEAHGREEAFDGVQPLRTVGWLAVSWPLFVRARGRPIGEVAGEVAESVRTVPRGGLGYAALRHTVKHEDIVALPEGKVLFSYLGRYGTELSDATLVRDPVDTGLGRSQLSVPAHVLVVNAWMEDQELLVNWILANRSRLRSTLTGAAEVFRSALEALAQQYAMTDDGGTTARRIVAPGTAIERLVHGIWAEVLGLDPEELGIDDDFSTVGGDSIHMIQIASRLRRAVGVRVPLRAILDRRTIRELAERVDASVAAT